jgi:hypothetical protein
VSKVIAKISLCGLVAHHATLAYACDDLHAIGLAPDQVADLCAAADVERPDWTEALSDSNLIKAGVILSADEKSLLQDLINDKGVPYLIRELVTTDKSCAHTVVLFGEEHVKLEKAARAGDSVVHDFRFRGYEFPRAIKLAVGLKPDRARRLQVAEHLMRQLEQHNVVFPTALNATISSGINVHEGYLFNNAKGHAFFADQGQGPTSFGALATFLAAGEEEKTLFMKTLNRWRAQSSIPAEVQALIDNPIAFVDAFSDVLAADSRAEFSFDLETGFTMKNAPECDGLDCEAKLILDLRNQFMAQNIDKIVPHLPCASPFLVVVGQSHLPGIEAQLKTTKNYQSTH